MTHAQGPSRHPLHHYPPFLAPWQGVGRNPRLGRGTPLALPDRSGGPGCAHRDHPVAPIVHAVHTLSLRRIGVIASPIHVPGSRLQAVACLGFVLIAELVPGPARAAFETARRSAMADVITVSEGGGGGTNVAFRAIPAAPGEPRRIPLPLGLAQLAAQPPILDVDNPDFSALAIADRLVLNPPDDLRLTSPPTGEGSTITIHLAEDEIILDFGEAKRLVPGEAAESGGRFAADLFTARVAGIDFGVTPLVIERSRLELSDDLTAALRDAEPLTANGVYSLDEEMEAAAALALGLTYARQVAGPAIIVEPGLPYPDPTGWRLYAGGGAKLLLGIAYFDNHARVDVLPTIPLLDPDDPTDVEIAGTVRTSIPGGGGSTGQGLAFDAGIAAVYEQAWEVGIGVADVGGWIRWRTAVDAIVVDDATGDLRTIPLARNEPYTQRLTPHVVLNVARHWGGGQTTVAADVRHGIEGMTGHLGTETHLGRYALRAGALVDEDGRVQASGGAGVRLGRIGIDSALYTRSANFVGDRALMLGVSLAIY